MGWELRVRRTVDFGRTVHSTITTSVSSLTALLAIVWLLLDVVVCNVPSLRVRNFRVGWFRRDGDDVPGVYEAWDEADTYMVG